MSLFFENFRDLNSILNDKSFAQFGDSVVNFIYNLAIYKAQRKLQGVKVTDKCLAKACKSSPLRKYIGHNKNKGDLGDAVEAFIGYFIIKNENRLSYLVDVLATNLKILSLQSKVPEHELCFQAFLKLLLKLCEEFNIS